MNIVHIIGNGFDLNQGLPTSYAHFYEYYLQLVPKDDAPVAIKNFRALLREKLYNKRTECWVDLETTLGEITEEFESVEDYETAYLDVYSNLMEYLNKVYARSMVEKFESPEKSIYSDLYYPWQYLVPSDRQKIEQMLPIREERYVSIINFNYTDTLKRVTDLPSSEEKPLLTNSPMPVYYGGCRHIHHTLAGRDIILGVDNIAQIAKVEFRNDERIQNYLIKPQTNSDLGTMIDAECKNLIQNAHLVCIYGMSIGETDRTWWSQLGKRIIAANNVAVIYFPFEKGINDILPIRYPLIRNEYKRKLMTMMGLKESTSLQRLFVNFCNLPGRNIFSNPKRANIEENFEDVMAQFQKEGKIINPNTIKNPFAIELRVPEVEPPLIEPKIYRERNLVDDLQNRSGQEYI